MMTKTQKTSVQLRDEAQLVENLLYNEGYPMKLKEIVESLQEIDWGRNPTNQIKTYMNQNENILRYGYGKYIHRSLSENENKDTKSKYWFGEEFLPEGKEINSSEDYEKLVKEFEDSLGKEWLKKVEDYQIPDIKFKDVVEDKSNKDFSVGEIVEGYVSGVVNYGVFVENLSTGLKGLIHISNISHETVVDPNRYFKVGDFVNAEVIEVKSKDKISLSTKGIPLNDYYSDKPDFVSREIEILTSYIISSTGMVSEKTKEKLEDIVNNNNLVDVSLAVSKVSEEFQADLSYKFIKEVEERMQKDYSVYDIEDHAYERWIERVNENISKEELVPLVASSQIVLDGEKYRYHKYKNVIFVCKKVNGICLIKTVLKDYMYINEKI